MSKPQSKLPPMSAVRVFEAAARHQSFTRAAEELGMTQAAVSYQIKILEDRVGAPLFIRMPRQVTLTAKGRQLAPAVTEAFEALRNAFSGVEDAVQSVLSLTTLSTFASNWLVPRLGSYPSAAPDCCKGSKCGSPSTFSNFRSSLRATHGGRIGSPPPG